MYSYPHPHPAVTTDIVIFTIQDEQLKVLLIRRGKEPYKNHWALPGGFVEIDEDLNDGALRELREETGITGVYLEQLYSFGKPDRDPRERVITVAYYALVPIDRLNIRPASDAKEVGWFSYDELPPLAFDHHEIIGMAHKRLASKIDYSTIALQFMPKLFTLSELQKVYEIIQGESLDKRNFRKRVLSYGCLMDTGKERRNGNHRPARLYSVKEPGKVEFIDKKQMRERNNEHERSGVELKDYRMPAAQVPETVVEILPIDERNQLKARIKHLLKQQNAVLVAHYYTDADLQLLADETGGCVSDSLEMARFGTQVDAGTLIVCGVRFMGETAKILNPEKRILMPTLEAECSLDIGCPIEEFSTFCDQYPDRKVVVYANTSAAVKARADWMVTSGSAVDVVRHLAAEGEKIVWAPDKYLGQYVQEQSGVDMLLWQGACVVHEEFKGIELESLRRQHPDAKVLVHPESPAFVIKQADVISSTTGIIKAAKELDAKEFIVATDNGIFHKLKETAPDKIFIEAPTAGHSATCKSCGHCPWMAMNSLRKLAATLESNNNEILVDPAIIERARLPIKRLLDFTQEQKKLAGDA